MIVTEKKENNGYKNIYQYSQSTSTENEVYWKPKTKLNKYIYTNRKEGGEGENEEGSVMDMWHKS